MKLLNKYLLDKRDSKEPVTVHTSDGVDYIGDVTGWDKRILRLAANAVIYNGEPRREYAEPKNVIILWRKVVTIF